MKLFRHPVLCNYYLTYRCNAKCGFCDIWEIPSPYVTLENVKENLLDLKKMKVRVIDFTGGEPLLHRQLPEFLTLAKDLGFLTTVTTNTLLYPKQAEALAGKVDMLHFSLDSVDEETHNQSRGVACFDHLLRSIKIAKKLGERPDILFTVTNDNLDEIEAAWQQFAIGEDLILILNPIFSYNEVGSSLTEQSLQQLRAWSRKKNIYLNEAFLDLRESGGNQIDDPVCRAGSSTVVISPENKLILPCYHLKVKEFAIEGRLRELYHSPEVQAEVALEGRLPGCQGCEVNCYMEPSMATETGKFFFTSLRSTLKYSLEKWIYSPLSKV